MTGLVTDYIIIKFYDITISFFLDVNFNKYISIWDYCFVKKKPLKPNEKLKKKPYVSIGKKSPKLNEKIKRKTWGFDQ